MTLIERQLHQVWNALRGQNTQRNHALTEVRIRNLRGIRDLRVPFNYPVSVLAGPNGCGKSTVLFACACAYRVPGRSFREFVPSSLFPNFTRSKNPLGLEDNLDATELEFYYVHDDERLSMMWRRGKAWNRSYMGRKGGKQPGRQVYLRTLANLTNPSEVRSLLQIARMDTHSEQVSPEMLIFAHRVLPRRYRNLSRIMTQSKDLLFAELEGGYEAKYSEFHMSSGERAILRISKDISEMQDALILIDEVEAGLHPYTQQMAMLEFQRIALRNRLQIIVASHSPVVLESVPQDARLFLNRDENTNEVQRVDAFRDILQKALYGQSRDQLSILCEDDVAEGLLRGFLDVLNPKLEFRHEDIIIGRDTGRDEFPSHIRTLAKFDKLRDFLFVLDGDSRHIEPSVREAAGEYPLQPLFLPGNDSPEAWLWHSLENRIDEYASLLGVSATTLQHIMSSISQVVEGAVSQNNSRKEAMFALAVELDRTPPDIARIVGKYEATTRRGEVAVLLTQMEEMITSWRQP